MSNEFEFLGSYTYSDDSDKREKAVRASLILVNTMLASNEGYYQNITKNGLISDLADKIQESLISKE